MEWNQQDLQTLAACFENTLSPLPEPRRKAESILAELRQKPNYGFAVLRLVAEPNVPDPIRQAASVNFKNHLKTHWAPAPSSDDPALPDPEKDQIKALIVSLMLSAAPKIQGQLSEALVLVSKHDFPRRWPTLLPELVTSLGAASNAGDYTSINGILGAANSIFKKFRYEYKTNDLLLDLKYCLDNFNAPLLEIFMKTAALIESNANAGGGNAVVFKPLFECQRLCCRIFYSLNFQELPEFFEDHMNEWMTEQKKYLDTGYPALEASVDGLALVDGLRAAVCENINLYMEKNEEEFQPYLNAFAVAVWNLLTTVSQASSRDQLAVTAIKFLTTVSTSVHHSLFAGEGVIPQICQGIVIPNVRLRDEDEELFLYNYIEFIRRDMEGSDLDTRRRIACELLKGIAINYKHQVTTLVSLQIQNLLSSFAANPSANWKDKDCAIYLVVSLATKKAGGTSVSTDLVDVGNFFLSQIVPELQSPGVNVNPMLKAGALKFFTMFRNQIPKDTAYLPHLIRFLVAESNVVHSYAASCIEKLLLIKEADGTARYTSVDISPVLLELMHNLFVALKAPDSEENQYVMKCIMRVLGVADISHEIAGHSIAGLTLLLNKACENPKNPVFNHYLFESVAVLVKRACGKDASLMSIFEKNLFPSIQKILGEDVAEFYPYALQLLAQLIELNKPPIPQSYMQVFPMLLSPDSWRKPSSVPALVRLLQAFLQKAPQELNQEGRLMQVLEIFNKLVSARSTDEQGFYVLNTIIESLDYKVIAPYIGQVWSCLFTVLQSRQTLKFIKPLLIFMSLFLVKHGSRNLVDSVNAIQPNGPNLFLMILGQFWIPSLKLITGVIETKLTAVASTRLLCECQSLLDAAAVEQWGKLLDSIVTLLSQTEQDRVEEDPEMPDIAENVGYSATFVRLHNAGKTEDDPLKDIRDAKEFLVTSLSVLSPGRSRIISQYVDQTNQAELRRLCESYNCQIR